jgi:hypothetical protein
MKAGERGSISPAGDLIAFGVALAIVVGLSGILPLMFPDPSNDDGIEPEAISAFLSWSGWDRDGDGILEESSLEGLSDSPLTIPLDGSYRVTLSFGDRDLIFLFEDGRISTSSPAPDVSLTHSVSILVRVGDGIVPGTMTISEVRE